MKEDIVSMFKKRALETLKSPKIKFILFGSRGRVNSHLFSEEEIKGLSFEPFIVNALEEGVAA